jgi:hypothetical protein
LSVERAGPANPLPVMRRVRVSRREQQFGIDL